jgi:hypothetical protein
LDLPDGVFVAGAWSAVVTIIDAGSNDIAPANMEFQIEPVPANVTEIEGSDPTDQINAACDAAIETYKLDHLVAVAESDDPVDNSIIAKMAASDGDWSGFSAATDSLEALRDQGDAAWITATGFATSGALTTVEGKVDTVDTVVDAILADTGTDGVVVAAASKTGYALASTGLDSINTTAPSGVASNFREMIVQTWRRFFKKSALTSTTLTTYADDGTTPITTQTASDDGSVQTLGAAS